MLINKSHLEGVGISPDLASQYISMLNRSCPSVTIKSTSKGIYRQGRQPTKNFELTYALKIARGYEWSLQDKVNTTKWRELRQALDKIKKEKK